MDEDVVIVKRSKKIHKNRLDFHYSNIHLWIKNSDITRNILQMEYIPDEIRELNRKLGDYCQLRIQQYNLILKSLPYLDDGRNPHDVQLDLVNIKIESLLEELD